MDRRRKIILQGKKYPCIEVLYKHHYKLHERYMVCIACYVLLPKVYKLAEASYGSPAKFVNKNFNRIIYSFLIVPVSGKEEAGFILESLKNSNVLTVTK